MNTLDDYNLWVVALSYLISVVGAFVSLNVSDYVRATSGRVELCWTVLAAVIFGGCAIWAMHFVGMLAYQPGVPITYDIQLTLISLVIPIAFTFGGFFTVYRWRGNWTALLLAGTTVGLGVATMHYTGMAAMRIDAEMTHVGWIMGVSVLIAVIAAIVALHIFVHWEGYVRQLSPFLMGVAVCGMHYTGMSAMRLSPANRMEPLDYYQGAWDPPIMAICTSGAVVFALAVGLVTVMSRQLSDLKTAGRLASSRAPAIGTTMPAMRR